MRGGAVFCPSSVAQQDRNKSSDVGSRIRTHAVVQVQGNSSSSTGVRKTSSPFLPHFGFPLPFDSHVIAFRRRTLCPMNTHPTEWCSFPPTYPTKADAMASQLFLREVKLFGLPEEKECSESTFNTQSMGQLKRSRTMPIKRWNETAAIRSHSERRVCEPQAHRSMLVRSSSYQAYKYSKEPPLSIMKRPTSVFSLPKSVHLSQNVLIHNGDLTTTEKMKLPPPPKVSIESLEMFKSLFPRSSSSMVYMSSGKRSSSTGLHLNKPAINAPASTNKLRSQDTSLSIQRQSHSPASAPNNSLIFSRQSLQRQKASRDLMSHSPSISESYIDASEGLGMCHSRS